jgi:hypothetical protein
MSIEFGTEEDFAKVLKEEREENLLPFDLDYVWMNCGAERTGKSMLGIYTGCRIDPNFGADRICSSLIDYWKLQQRSALLRLSGLICPVTCSGGASSRRTNRLIHMLETFRARPINGGIRYTSFLVALI